MKRKTIFLITRCSRPQYLDFIKESVCKFANEVTDYFDVVWGIGFDVKKVSSSLANNYDITEDFPSNLSIFVKNYITSQALFGSNMSTAMVKDFIKFAKPIEEDSYVYLLDDDNDIHPNFANVLKSLLADENKNFVCFGQTRKTGDVIITDKISADTCLGWIDSAQFLINCKIIKDMDFFVKGYCSDGLTVKKYFETHPGLDGVAISDEIGAYYNYFTELKDWNE